MNFDCFKFMITVGTLPTIIICFVFGCACALIEDDWVELCNVMLSGLITLVILSLIGGWLTRNLR